MQAGLYDKYTALQSSGVVPSLVKLEDGGIAAGTDAPTVDLFNFSAMSPNGLDVKYKTFQASGDVLSLLKLEDGGLAADTGASTVDLFNLFFGRVT